VKFVKVRHPQAGEATVPESALGQLASQGWTAVDEDLAQEVDPMPSGNATLEEWSAYALGHGMSDEDVAGKSRNEIRDHFRKD